jgi:tetratricopeptide (TPR) repeat protein
MAYVQPYKQRSGGTLQIILILLGVIAALCASLFIAKLGPKAPERSTKDAYQDRRELEDIEEKSRQKWNRFVTASEFRPKLEPDDIKLLEEALTLREEYVMRSGSHGDPTMLIDEIRQKWQTIKATECREKSVAIEAIAIEAIKKGEFNTAAKTFEEALTWEKRIEDEFPLSKMKNITRTTHLEYEIRHAESRPIYARTIALEKEGDTLAAQRNWEEAATAYKEAHELENTLRIRYQGMFPLILPRLNNLEASYETMKSTPEYELIQSSLNTARKLATNNAQAEAEQQWSKALIELELLSKKYPRSRHINPKILENLWSEHDHTLIKPHAAELSQAASAINEALRSGRTSEVATRSVLALQKESLIQKKFPRARALPLDTRKQLQFISLKTNEIPVIKNLLADMFKPLPSHKTRLLFRSEIPQALYSALMDGENPSASRDAFLPVDSVSYTDALLFCQRLSWVTGHEIRLPTQKEFLDALGTLPDRPTLASQAHAFENSANKVRPINTGKPNSNGFNDLLGNVSEWLQTDVFSNEATEIGGNYQTNLDTLLTIPSKSIPKREKNRLRGFRVLMENSPPH